ARFWRFVAAPRTAVFREVIGGHGGLRLGDRPAAVRSPRERLRARNPSPAGVLFAESLAFPTGELSSGILCLNPRAAPGTQGAEPARRPPWLPSAPVSEASQKRRGFTLPRSVAKLIAGCLRYPSRRTSPWDRPTAWAASWPSTTTRPAAAPATSP